MKFSKSCIVITGGSRGIGLSLASRFLERGSSVVLVARSFAENFMDQFSETEKSRVTLEVCDLGVALQRDTLIERLLQRVDITGLVNNAGFLTGSLLHEISPEDIDRCIQVNLIATMQLTRALLPQMLAKDEGLIMNNASVSSEFYFPGAQTYAASKAGVSLFTKSLTMELEASGIQVMLMMTPGVKTKMYDDIGDKYGDFLNLDFLSSISTEEWTDIVFEALDSKKAVCYPKGKTRVGLFLNRHFPSLYERGMMSSFKGSR